MVKNILTITGLPHGVCIKMFVGVYLKETTNQFQAIIFCKAQMQRPFGTNLVYLVCEVITTVDVLT